MAIFVLTTTTTLHARRVINLMSQRRGFSTNGVHYLCELGPCVGGTLSRNLKEEWQKEGSRGECVSVLGPWATG